METEVIKNAPNKSNVNVALLLDRSIFDQFKSLSSKSENERISSTMQLIEYFNKNNELPESDLKVIIFNLFYISFILGNNKYIIFNIEN